MQKYPFKYFLCFLITIIIFLVSNSNFTKKEEYMNMDIYEYILYIIMYVYIYLYTSIYIYLYIFLCEKFFTRNIY